MIRLLSKSALLLTLATVINLSFAADQPATNSDWQKAVQLQQQNVKTDPTNLKAALSAVAQQPTTKTIPVNTTTHVTAAATPSTRTQAVKISSNKPAPQAHVWNLKDADLMQVIAEVARETGKNFIVDPQVSGKVTIISTKPLAADEVYQVFLSTLQVLNFAAVPTANAIKIIQLHDASREAGKVYSGAVGEGGAMVVNVIPLHYISAIQLVPILNPLIPTWATVSAVVTANSLIVSGSQSVVNRVNQIVARVDTPASNGVDFIPMQYSIADDVAKELTDLIQSARSYGEMVNIAISSDERSNSILLSGNAAARLRLKVLISQLDQPGANGMGDTQVIHLHYIQVQDILPILRGIANQNPGAAGASSGGSAGVSMQSNSSSNSGSGSGGLTSDYSSFTNQVQSITNAELNSGAVTSTGANGKPQQTIITGDVTNNALIITAPNGMMLKLKSVINRLDVRPQQVLVQGVIAEVDADKAQNFGIQWGTNAASPGDIATLGPTSSFAATGGMGVGMIKDGDFRAVVQALSTDSSSNVLSTPSITVLNNGHADIEVGETISETTGQYQTPSNGSGSGNGEPYIQYQDKNVGLTLTVTPQITGDDSIRMAIDQTNSTIIEGSTSEANPNPATTQEKVSTSVLINNGQILVLGGLMSSQLEKVIQKVPLLGDIPLIGLMFRHNTDRDVKKVLLIFLRPVVMDTPDQANSLSLDRYNFLRDRQILTDNGQTDFTASSTLMSPNGIVLPVPFSDKS